MRFVAYALAVLAWLWEGFTLFVTSIWLIWLVVVAAIILTYWLFVWADNNDRKRLTVFRAEAKEAYAKCIAAGGQPTLPLLRDPHSDVTLCLTSDGRVAYAIRAELKPE